MTSLGESVEFLNQQPRCACALILDTSGSMSGDPIRALNEGLRVFHRELMNDEQARKRVDVAIVEFNSNVRVVQDFVTAESFQPPTLTASGLTDMVGGIKQGLDLLNRRKAIYKSNGVPFYRPWAFLITDGQASGYEQLALRIREDEANKHVSFFAVGVNNADMSCLRQISVRDPIMLDGINFKEMFLWLSASLGQVSRSTLGKMVPLAKPTWEAVE